MTLPTSFRAEPEGFVCVVVVGGGTPAVAVIPALGGASVITLPLEGEGEFTRSALCVATQGEEHCNINVGR